MTRITMYAMLATICLSPLHARSQGQTKIDSLLTSYRSVASDTMKVNILNALVAIYNQQNIDSAIYFGSKALNEARSAHFPNGMLNANIAYGKILATGGRNQEAIDISRTGIAYADSLLALKMSADERKKRLLQKASILTNFGISFDYMGIYPEALKYYTEALKIQENCRDKKSTAGTLHNIGNVYLELEKIDEAIGYYKSAMAINKELGNFAWLARNLCSLAEICIKRNKIDSALANYREAIAIYVQLNDNQSLMFAVGNVGNLFMETGRNDSAIVYLNRALELNNMLGIPQEFVLVYMRLASLYKGMGNNKIARDYLKKAEEYLKELDENRLLENYYDFKFSLDSADRRLDDAIQDLIMKSQYYSKYHNEENAQMITQTRMTYDFEKKDAAARAEQERKDTVQRNVRNSTFAGLVGALIFGVVVMRQRNRVKKEKARSEELLLNILPAEVAEELKAKGSAEAKLIDEVTVLFTDFKGFTQLSETLSPKELVSEINACFSAFDNIMQKHGVEKIKTIGDAYMAAGGLPTPNNTHAEDVVKAALEIQDFMHRHKEEREASGQLFFEIRIGVHTGPVVAGIVGIKKFAYDIWGDTVNTASRMESSGTVGKVNISQTTYELVKNKFSCEYRGEVEAKGKGGMKMYYVG